MPGVTREEALTYLWVDAADEKSVALVDTMRAAATDYLFALDVGQSDAKPVKQAQLMLIGHWYHNRPGFEERNADKVMPAILNLVAPYRSVTL